MMRTSGIVQPSYCELLFCPNGSQGCPEALILPVPGARGRLPLRYASMTDRPVKREGRKAVAFTTVHQPSMRGLATAIVILHHRGSCIHLATGILRNADTPSVDNEDSPQAATAFPLPLDPGVSSFFEQMIRT